MKHEKTFAAIEKLKDVELELHRLKNALELANKALDAQPAQEPVAWAVVGEGKFGLYEIGRETETDLSVCKYWENRGYNLVPLYTTPPQRPWVGLTQEQFTDAARLAEDGNYLVAFQRIQQWLKEKNT
jgi:hypothetical protein